MNVFELNNIRTQIDEFTLSINELSISKDRIHSITGPNGSGKSTLLNLLALMIKPHSGSIKFNGNEIDLSGNIKELTQQRREISYLMQNPYLFNTTVYKNISYGLELRSISNEVIRERTEAIIEKLGLSSLRDRNAHRISKGEAQRVAFARTIVLESDIIILDEPTAYVDKESVDIIENMIRELKTEHRAAIIMSTHSGSQVERLSDRNIHMEFGSITKQD